MTAPAATLRAVDVREAAGGGRLVAVPAARLARWRENFVATHGPAEVGRGAVPDGYEGGGAAVVLRAVDGTQVHAWEPLPRPAGGEAPVDVDADAWEGLARAAARPRRLLVLLVRLGGHVVAEVHGADVVRSRTGARQVHGRTRKGGSSSGRFARRRDGQAATSLAAAAQAAVEVLLPRVAAADALLLGGDRDAAARVLADPRLVPLAQLPRAPWADVPEPRARVLPAALVAATAVRVLVRDAPGPSPPPTPPAEPPL